MSRTHRKNQKYIFEAKKKLKREKKKKKKLVSYKSRGNKCDRGRRELMSD